MEILPQLKQRTADLHQEVESKVPLMDPDLTLRQYEDYLSRFYPFLEAMEGQLQRVPGLSEKVGDLHERWKSDLLARDLQALGVRPFAEAFHPPRLQSVAQAMGCLYVMEGSTLGGQILVRSLREKFGEAVAGRTSYLESYGDQVATKWKRLKDDITEALSTPEDREAAILAARATFESLLGWLEGSLKAA